MVSFKKNPYKSPKIRIFEKIRTKIRTCTEKSVRVGTLITQSSYTKLIYEQIFFFLKFHHNRTNNLFWKIPFQEHTQDMFIFRYP